jgi:multiple sugar transport system ATP-binding protein
VASVNFEQVTKQFDDYVAVNNLNLEIADGEFLVFVGPSGCGKTTSLRLLAGLESITSGQICIGDRRVNELSPKDRDIAMVFQSYALYPQACLKIWPLAWTCKVSPNRKSSNGFTAQRPNWALKHYSTASPRNYPGGQRQRVAVGQAIVRKPLVFLMDKPLSNTEFVARIDPRVTIKAQDAVTFLFDAHRLHYFDRERETALG